MKQVKFAFATLMLTALLSGCINMYDTMEPQFGSDQHFNMMDTHQTKQPRPRHHYTRGEQVGPEVPFTESTASPSAEQKPAMDAGKANTSTKPIPTPSADAATKQ